MSSLASRILNWGFRGYVRRFVRRNFNAVRVAGCDVVESLPAGPIVCFINHPGWWDPMTGVLMTDLLFPGRRFAAPMDAEALIRYPVLERLGFFALGRDTVTGAKDFLRTSCNLLNQTETILWLTPTGNFCDIREPASFMSGLGHLVDRDFQGTALPMAIEYTFWNERCPELLVQFGSPVAADQLPPDRDSRTLMLEHALARAQASLATLAIARKADAFTTIESGRAGIGGLYDSWRRVTAWVRGSKFRKRHEVETAIVTGSIKADLT